MSINQGRYCLAEDTVNVTDGPRLLPQNWQNSSGQWYYNINNTTAWDDPALLVIGWYPYVLVDAGEPGPYYTRTVGPLVVQSTEVVQTASYEQWPIEDVKAQKNLELESQVSQYTLNDSAINPKVTDYINDDVKWVADEQAKLARLTDWESVADFDTTKPVVLTLPNSYVGAKNVRQGVSLTAQNTAAVDSGITAIWDQTEINAYVSGNQLAADDSSNATTPVAPNFRIRQGIANVSEQFNRVVIYRFDRDDPIPSLRRSFAMQMTNRQDNRNLYVFSYTNSTYLAWHLFELQSDGVTWFWEAAPAEMQYTDTDMGFIFSYSTNPAVEADYFTDRIEFPAGVEEDNILVAWDTQ